MQVDIFLFTSSRAPSVSTGRYEYVLFCRGQALADGGETGPITGHRLALTCAGAALKRMTKPAEITIHTDCRYLINGLTQLRTWKGLDWTKPGGAPLKNADLWKQLADLTAEHEIKGEYCPTLNAKKWDIKMDLLHGKLPCKYENEQKQTKNE